jgi:hypothetical protein
MVLQRADLPTGFTTTATRDRPNRVVATETGMALGTIRAWGRLGGHEATYDRPVDRGKTPAGPASVIATVSLYRATVGARKAFDASAARLDGSGPPRQERRPAPASLGNERAAWITRLVQDGVPVVIHTIVWRSGTVLGSVTVAGVAGKTTFAQALALARRQQARIAGRAVALPPPVSGPVA